MRKYVNREVLKQLVHAFIIRRLDYCNCMLAEMSHSVQTAIAYTESTFSDAKDIDEIPTR